MSLYIIKNGKAAQWLAACTRTLPSGVRPSPVTRLPDGFPPPRFPEDKFAGTTERAVQSRAHIRIHCILANTGWGAPFVSQGSFLSLRQLVEAVHLENSLVESSLRQPTPLHFTEAVS